MTKLEDKIHAAFRRSAEIEDARIGPGNPSAFIQWKGTDVCMDTYCKCGHSSHVDGEFVYMWRCPKCGTTYVVGCHVHLHEMTKEEADAVDATKDGRIAIGNGPPK